MRLYGVTGWKNAGKTGLMERLVTEISSRGFSVSTLKHAHHSFDVDQPGRDSHRHRVAGATEVLLSSGTRWALMHELRGRDEPPLEMLLVAVPGREVLRALHCPPCVRNGRGSELPRGRTRGILQGGCPSALPLSCRTPHEAAYFPGGLRLWRNGADLRDQLLLCGIGSPSRCVVRISLSLCLSQSHA